MERPFPRTPLLVLTTLLALLVPGTLALAHADDLDDKHKQVRKDIGRAEQHLEETSADLGRAMARLRTARTGLDKAQAQYAHTRAELARAVQADTRMRQQLAQAQAQLAQAQADLARGKAAVAQQRDDIGRLAAQNYAYGDPGLLRLDALLNSQDPADLAFRMNTLDNVMVREDTTLSTLGVLRDKLAATEQRVRAYEATVAERREQTRAIMQRKQQISVAARNQRNQVLSLFRARKSAERQARHLRKRDLRQLHRLKELEARIAQEIRDRAAQQSGGYTGHSNGFLTRPVPGWVTSPFGYRVHPIYGYYGLHNGTDFHTPCGQPMVAGASGTVVEKYYDDVYGHRLYIDVGRVNGKNLTIVYNHATGYRVGRGEHVRRGEVVGHAGSTGWSTGCHLHFMTLVNGTPVDPMKFL